MPEEPTPSPEPTPQSSEDKGTDDIDTSTPLPEPTPQSSASQSSEEEWTDDIDTSIPENAPSASVEIESPAAEWGDNPDWENEPVEPPEPSPAPPSTQEALAWLQPLWRRGLASWRQILAGIRSRIPATARLSDSLLGGILIGGLVLLIVVLNSVRQSPVVASGPVEPAPPETASAEDTLSAADDSLPLSPDVATESVEPDVATESIEVDPVSEIQTQLIDSSVNYGDDLVESVQADFKHSQLTINLSNRWYGLSADKQEALADDLRQQSIQMAFEDLEVRSPEGELLARSPVVGNEMIILQREQPPEVPLPSRPRYRITVDTSK